VEHQLMVCSCGGRQFKRPFSSLCPICDCGEDVCVVCGQITFELEEECPGPSANQHPKQSD